MQATRDAEPHVEPVGEAVCEVLPSDAELPHACLRPHAAPGAKA
jgi:hypothetical protein